MCASGNPEGGGAETLAACLARFEPATADLAAACLERLRALVPGATELVYDAYNALSIPLGTSDRLGDAFVGIVVYPRHVNLAFHRGAELDDPDELLQGTGSRIRSLRLDDAARLSDRRIVRLVRAAAANAGFRARRGQRGEVVVKKLYARQRPRRRG